MSGGKEVMKLLKIGLWGKFGIEELDSNDEAEVPAHLQKARDLPFDKNNHGVFILPPMQNYKTIHQ